MAKQVSATGMLTATKDGQLTILALLLDGVLTLGEGVGSLPEVHLGTLAGRDRDRFAAPVRSVRARTAPASRAVAHLSRQSGRGVLPGRPSGTSAPGAPSDALRGSIPVVIRPSGVSRCPARSRRGRRRPRKCRNGRRSGSAAVRTDGTRRAVVRRVGSSPRPCGTRGGRERRSPYGTPSSTPRCAR